MHPMMANFKKNLLKSIAILLLCFNTYKIEAQGYNNSPVMHIKIAFSHIKNYWEEIKRFSLNKLDKTDEKIFFIDLLLSENMPELLRQIKCPVLDLAESLLSLLKESWPWDREYTFLIPNLDNNKEESDFISELGFDIMKIVERDHITREDYIIKHTDEQSFKRVQEYKEKCIQLQKKGDLYSLAKEVNRLYNRVIKNGKATILSDNICLAIVEKIYLDPITRLLHTIKHAPTLAEAEEASRILDEYLLKEAMLAKEKKIADTKAINNWNNLKNKCNRLF